MELAVLQRHLREQDAAIELAFSRSGLPPAYCPRHRMQEGRIGIAQPARTWASVVSECQPGIPVTFTLLETKKITGLYLWGVAGSFKTSVAAAYMAKEIASGRHGRYAYVPSIFSELFAIYASSNSGMSRADIVERYGFAELLVLDDLGKEKPTEHGAAVINEILDLRYRSRRGWTIITSNYPIEDFEARINAAVGEEYGQPIARRIVELCEMVPMEPR